jgi:hypothetical protein
MGFSLPSHNPTTERATVRQIDMTRRIDAHAKDFSG